MIFFAYAAWIVFKFYHTYNMVSSRMLRLSFGNVMGFVRWMQVCCDLIILFGISSVAITSIFPTDFWPFTLLGHVCLYRLLVEQVRHHHRDNHRGY